MDKVLVTVFVPIIIKQYDVWIPIDKTVYEIMSLLLKGISELNDCSYEIENKTTLYNKITGLSYDINKLIKETDIENGTELILI